MQGVSYNTKRNHAPVCDVNGQINSVANASLI